LSAEKAILAFFRLGRSRETPRVSRIDAAASSGGPAFLPLPHAQMLRRRVGERGGAAGDTRLPQDSPSPCRTGLAIAEATERFPTRRAIGSAEKAILAFFRLGRSRETPRVSRIDAAASSGGWWAVPCRQGSHPGLFPLGSITGNAKGFPDRRRRIQRRLVGLCRVGRAAILAFFRLGRSRETPRVSRILCHREKAVHGLFHSGRSRETPRVSRIDAAASGGGRWGGRCPVISRLRRSGVRTAAQRASRALRTRSRNSAR
jgi:hypothetical protein